MPIAATARMVTRSASLQTDMEAFVQQVTSVSMRMQDFYENEHSLMAQAFQPDAPQSAEGILQEKKELAREALALIGRVNRVATPTIYALAEVIKGKMGEAGGLCRYVAAQIYIIAGVREIEKSLLEIASLEESGQGEALKKTIRDLFERTFPLFEKIQRFIAQAGVPLILEQCEHLNMLRETTLDLQGYLLARGVLEQKDRAIPVFN